MAKSRKVSEGTKDQGVKEEVKVMENKDEVALTTTVVSQEDQDKVEKDNKRVDDKQEKEEGTMEGKMQSIAIQDGISKSAKMKMMFDLGAEIKEIAKVMNVRYNFVYNVISNYCIVKGVQLPHTHKESKKDKIWAMFDQGKTVKETAIELKTNYQYVYKLHKEWAIKAEEEAQKIIDADKAEKAVGGDK